MTNIVGTEESDLLATRGIVENDSLATRRTEESNSRVWDMYL